MTSNQRGEELRETLAKAERSGAGRPYPEALRRVAVEYGRQRQREGAGVAAVAAELGVSGMSLSRWSREMEPTTEAGFRAIELVAEPTRSASAVLVHGPRGVRIEGLTVADVVELIERLS